MVSCVFYTAKISVFGVRGYDIARCVETRIADFFENVLKIDGS